MLGRLWIAGLLVLAVSAFATSACTAQAQAPSATAKDRAYTMTLMCAVVAVDSGNDADYARTMDAARKMGRAMAYTDKRVSDDLWAATNVLGAERRSKPEAMGRHRELCRKLKLVS